MWKKAGNCDIDNIFSKIKYTCICLDEKMSRGIYTKIMSLDRSSRVEV